MTIAVRAWTIRVATLSLFVLLTTIYLAPGPAALWAGRTDTVMSDDTDPSALPHAYDALLRAFDQDWTNVFYGAVVIDQGHPDHDTTTWFPWVERVIVIVARHLVPIEQMSTLVVMVLMTATALSFFGLARAWGWSYPLALGLAMAWAFCPFERARAQVHTAMTGTYHLPLIFLGLHLVARRRDRRSVAWAALCFVAACTTLQYLIIVAAALSPFYALYLWLASARGTRRRTFARALVAALPAVLFLGWSLKFPVPARANLGVTAIFPQTGRAPAGELHPFLSVYAARPLDFLGGDIALTHPAGEWLAPRAWIDDHTLKTLGNGNVHERTNGIRWSLLVLALCGLIFARGPDRRLTWLFAGFAASCFWLSLAPDQPFADWGPSGWLWRIIPQVRVPSRAGIGAHFGVLMMVGFGLGRAAGSRARRWLARALPLLVLLEYPPLTTPLSMAPVRPVYSHLVKDQRCATGLFFPFVNDDLYPVIYYHFKQRLRGTGCTVINAYTEPDEARSLYQRFPTSNEYLARLESDPAAEAEVVKLARCVPLGWIAFDPMTPPAWRERTCAKLGWRLFEDLSCVDPAPVTPLMRSPRVCR